MDLLQLKQFQVVARLENVTRAAEELHIAQPSLSKTIARLEENIGAPLFERQGRRLHLNQYGKIFLRRVEQCFYELEEGQREIADLAGLKGGCITVGATTTVLLPHILEYLELHPLVKFQFFQGIQHLNMQERLIKGEIDLCVSTLPIKHPEIICEPLMSEKIFLAVPSGHHFADRKSIQLKEVACEPFVLQTAEYGFREITNDFCQQAGFIPQISNIAFESPTIDVVCSLVKAGFGNAFIPACWWDISNTDSLVKLHIENPPCQRIIWISWVKKHYMSLAARDFKEFIVKFSKDPNIKNT